jgi:hypothetical protein
MLNTPIAPAASPSSFQPDEYAHDAEWVLPIGCQERLLASPNPTNTAASHGLESTDPSLGG